MNIQKKIQLHPHQKAFYHSDARFRALVSGIGGGKTKIGVIEAGKIMGQYPGSLGCIVAPTYRMLSDTTRREFLDMWEDIISDFNKGENKMMMANGAEVLFRSAEEPDKIRGPNLGWFYIDEASMVSRRCFQILQGRLREPPERGWATATPKGHNWLYFYFKKSDNPNYWCIQFSSKNNPWLSNSYLQSLEESYGGIFYRQEVMGEFVKPQGLVYQNFKRDTHIVKTDDLPQFKYYVGGADFGWMNPSVLLVIGVDTDGRLWIVDELYERQMNIEAYVQEAEKFHSRYGFRMVYADPASPEYIDALNRGGVPARGVTRKVLDGIGKVSNFLVVRGDGWPRLLVHEGCVNTIMEFENYRYKEDLGEDKPVKDKPVKMYDHAMDSLSYVCISEDNVSGPVTIGDLTDLTG